MNITKSQLTENSGIYVWINTVNGKVYVGQGKNVYNRVRRELWELRRGEGHNEHFQNAFNKYGEDVFAVGVLCECDKCDLNDAESLWGNYFDARNPECGYNIRDYGNGQIADETRQKMRDAWTPERRAAARETIKMAHSSWTDEMKIAQADAVSEAQRARYGYDEMIPEIIGLWNFGFTYAEIKRATGANTTVVQRIVRENEHLVNPVKLTERDAFEYVKSGLIDSRRAAGLCGAKSIKWFNARFNSWMAENDN